MNKSLVRAASVAALVLAGGVTYMAYAGEKEGKEGGAAVPLPAAAQATIDNAYPGSTVGRVEMEDEDGMSCYEVKLKTKDGKAVEVEVSAEGQVLESEESVGEADLPPAVAKTLKDILPGGEFEELEKKTMTVYSIEKEVGGRTYEIELDGGGNVLSIEAEYEEGDDD